MSQRAGWYDDPENPEHLRYFDGVVWTSHTTPRSAPSAAPSAAPSTVGIPQGPPTQQLPAGPPPQYSQPSQYSQPPQYGQQPPYGGQQQGYGQQPGYGQQDQPGYSPMPQGYPPVGYTGALGVKTTPDGVPLASYGQRVGAYILDYIIVGVITLLAGGYWLNQFVQWYIALIQGAVREVENGATTTSLDTATIQDEVMRYLWPIALISLLVHLAYHTFFLTRTGATPGKMALGITVRRRDRPGALSLGDALKRQLIDIAAGLLGFVGAVSIVASLGSILDLLWPLWDDKRQALHDKIAGTNVVLRRRER